MGLKILVFSLVVFIAGARAQASTTGLDVNDVSFLFPLKDGLPYPAINLQQEELLSLKLFGQVIQFEKKVQQLEDLPYTDSKFLGAANWYVTSFRFEHCGEVFELEPTVDPLNQEPMLLTRQKPGCQARLRIVIQPFNHRVPLASAMHLVYQLSEKGAALAIQQLLMVKEVATSAGFSTSGKPLMVHPSLKGEVAGNDSRVANVVKLSLLSMLAESRPDILTLSIRVTVNHWKFVGGYVQKDNWLRMVTDFSRQFYDGSGAKVLMGVEEIACDNLSICSFQPNHLPGRLNPAGTVVSEIFQNKPEWKVLQVPGRRTREIGVKAEILDNPHKTNFFNTNCMGCHQSSNLRDRQEILTDLKSPPGVTPFVPRRFLDMKTNNVINFGYFGSIARVSTRTAADSAEVASAINKQLGLAHPAPHIKELSEFWQCLVSQNDSQKCLRP